MKRGYQRHSCWSLLVLAPWRRRGSAGHYEKANPGLWNISFSNGFGIQVLNKAVTESPDRIG